MRRSLPVIAWLWLAGCGQGFVQRATTVAFDPGGADFWSLPLPCEERAAAPEVFALTRWPAAHGDTMVGWLAQGDVILGGRWGINTGAFLPMSGAVDPATLPTEAASTLGPDAAVFIVDVDPASPELGRRFPLVAQLPPAGDELSPPNLLQVLPVPGFPRRPNTRYAAVVTDRVHDSAGVPVGRTRAFHEAFESGALRVVRDALDRERYPLERVAGATVFTTIDVNGDRQRLFDWAERQPVPALETPWAVLEEYPDFTVLTARLTLPQLQHGVPPYTAPGEGRITWSGDAPVVQTTQAVRVALSIPRGVAPDAGTPLTIFVHGTGGDYRQFLDRGPLPEVPSAEQGTADAGTGPALWLARRGVAAFGYDLPLHGTRSSPPESLGLLFTNLQGDLRVAVANRLVAAMELSLLTRFLARLTVDLGGGRTVTIDPERLSALTQSLGSTIGVPWLSVEPRIRTAVLSGAGGSLIEQAVNEHQLFEALFAIAPGVLHRGQPLLHVLQSIADPVDPVSSAAALRRDDARLSVLMTSGVVDARVTPQSQAALAAALGVALVGPTAEPIVPATLDLAGAPHGEFPFQGNWNGRTGALIQVSAPNQLGHHAIFNQEPVRHQYTCFLASVPAVVVAGAAFDAPCH